MRSTLSCYASLDQKCLFSGDTNLCRGNLELGEKLKDFSPLLIDAKLEEGSVNGLELRELNDTEKLN